MRFFLNRALIVIMHSVTSTVRLNRYLISYAKATTLRCECFPWFPGKIYLCVMFRTGCLRVNKCVKGTSGTIDKIFLSGITSGSV